MPYLGIPNSGFGKCLLDTVFQFVFYVGNDAESWGMEFHTQDLKIIDSLCIVLTGLIQNYNPGTNPETNILSPENHSLASITNLTKLNIFF